MNTHAFPSRLVASVEERHAPRQADTVDVHVGSRIRLRRAELKISQHELADRLGIAFQQVQKYEVGRNRVSASRLVEIAAALTVPASYFFEGVEKSSNRRLGGAMTPASLHKIVNDPSMLRLLRTISQIDNASVRERAAMVVKTIAG